MAQTKGRVATRPNVTATDDILTVPAGRAYAGPPLEGRRMWAITVLRCPRCFALHQHRAVDSSLLLSGKAVRTCPATHRPYTLAPVERMLEARRG